MSASPSPGRRSVLRGSIAASAALSLPALGGAAAPALARRGRPRAEWGVQAGDVTAASGLVWVRSDRPARMIVETSATESFRKARRWIGPLVGPAPTSPAGPAARAAGRRTGALPGHARRPRRPAAHGRAGDRHVPHRAVRRRAGGPVPVVGRHRGPGLGHQPGPRRLPRSSRRCAGRDPDFFLYSGDTIYADGPIEASVTCPTAGVAQRHHRGEVEGRPDARRLPRQLPLQPARRALRAFNAAGAVRRPVGRPRGAQQLVPGRDPRPTTRYTEQRRRRPRGALAAGVPRVQPGRRCRPATRTAGSTGKIATGPLLDVFVLDMRTYRRTPTPPAAGRRPDAASWAREQLQWLKRELTASGRCGRSSPPTCRSASSCPTARRPTSRRSRRATRARRWAGSCSSRSSCRHIKHERITGTRVAHRRRALHRGASLRPDAGRVHGLRRRSGSSCRGR